MFILIGELGFKEIGEYIDKRMLNFWFNIATGEKSKIPTILYKWVKVLYGQNIFKSVWLDEIKATLGCIGMLNCFGNMKIQPNPV